MLIPITIVLAAVTLALLAVVAGYVLGWANRKFHVELDPKVAAIIEALPGANCGGCGYVGCAEYAEAVAKGEAEVTLCAPGGTGCAQDLAEIMGIEVEQTWPYKAVIHCDANEDQRLQRAEYHGEATCAAANLIAGVQGCTYGCLGFGDCERVCDYGAITMVKGLPVIDYKKCVGCRACARACSRNIITMAPFKSETILVIACSNHDSGKDVKVVCTVGCLGCKGCVRANPELFSVQDNLPALDYDKYDPETSEVQPVLDKCPRASLVFVGKPTEKDLAALASEKVSEHVQADS